MKIFVFLVLVVFFHPLFICEGAFIRGEIAVGVKPGADLSELNNRYGALESGTLESINARIIRFGPGYDAAEAAAAYAGHPDVLYAELNFTAEAQAVIPKVPYFDYQWYLRDIFMPGAWRHYRGSADIIVAVLDSGIESAHPELEERLVEGYNFIDGRVDAEDDNGHGTYIAGLIGARADNGLGIAGVNWDVRLMPVKVLDIFGVGAYSEVAAGIIFAAENGARVINLSLGGAEFSFLLQDAVNYAAGLGCVLVASTGNSDRREVFYPAAYENVIAVGAGNESGRRCSQEDWGPGAGSNYGPGIDLIAPGNNILSLYTGGGYAYFHGTSASAALVSGAAAVLLSAKNDMSAAELRLLVNSTAGDEGGAWDEETGYGGLNVEKAIAASGAPLAPDLPAGWFFLRPPGWFWRLPGIKGGYVYVE